MRYAACISKDDVCLLYKNTVQILSLAHGSRDGRIYLHARNSAILCSCVISHVSRLVGKGPHVI